MQRFCIQPGGSLQGTFQVPGDKSISHRAVMLSAIADGASEITGFLTAEDTLATLKAMQQLGVNIEQSHSNLLVHGVGLHGLQPAQGELDCGNSGTGMRLLAGLLAGQKFSTILTGDESLQQRPMERIVTPLREMGAKIETAEQDRAPLTLQGGQQLHAIEYALPVASAQVKSCVLLAGLYADGITRIEEPAVTRDHTERMLQTFGCDIETQARQISISGSSVLKATALTVPTDLSSAAFFIVGASIAPDSNIILKNVGINPTRTGIIDLLLMMGANITLENKRQLGAEPVADIHVQSADLRGIEIPTELVSLAIDEFPALFIAAACAQGTTVLRGAEELRVKESDRIQVMADGLTELGIETKVQPDGLQIIGGSFQSGRINSHGDHRIAMAFAMAGLRAQGRIDIEDCQNVATSFPNFVALAQTAGLLIKVED